MTIEFNYSIGASPNLEWHSINWKQVKSNVSRLQVRMVEALKESFKAVFIIENIRNGLSRDAVKVARPVLRGG